LDCEVLKTILCVLLILDLLISLFDECKDVVWFYESLVDIPCWRR